MQVKDRYDRFHIARYKRAFKRRKRRPFLKNKSINKVAPFLGFLDLAFFASRQERKERLDKLKQDKNLEKEQLLEASEQVVKQKGKKKYWSLIFLLVNIAVISIILLNQAEVRGFTSFSELLESGANFNFIFLALLGFVLLTLLDSAKVYLLLYKAIGRSRHFLSYKVSAIGRYYDLLTPLGTGGQPFQVYYLNKRGVKSQIATSVPLAKYIFSQISFVSIALIALLTNTFAAGNNAIVVSLAWVGLFLNLLLVTVVFVLSASKTVGPRVVIAILKLLSKIKIVKNYEVAFKKVMRFVKEYQKSIRHFTSSLPVVLMSVSLAVLYVLVQGTIPFLIYSAFNGFEPSMWWTILSKLVILEFAVSFIPLPGGAGAAELSFTGMFGSLFRGGSFFWAILIWRFTTYYLFIIQGFVIMVYDMIIGDKKAARLNKIGFWKDVPKSYKFYKQNYK